MRTATHRRTGHPSNTSPRPTDHPPISLSAGALAARRRHPPPRAEPPGRRRMGRWSHVRGAAACRAIPSTDPTAAPLHLLPRHVHPNGHGRPPRCRALQMPVVLRAARGGALDHRAIGGGSATQAIQLKHAAPRSMRRRRPPSAVPSRSRADGQHGRHRCAGPADAAPPRGGEAAGLHAEAIAAAMVAAAGGARVGLGHAPLLRRDQPLPSGARCARRVRREPRPTRHDHRPSTPRARHAPRTARPRHGGRSTWRRRRPRRAPRRRIGRCAAPAARLGHRQPPPP